MDALIIAVDLTLDTWTNQGSQIRRHIITEV